MFLDESGLEILRTIVTQHRPGLIIVDPIQSFFDGSKDMNRSNHIRAVLSPLIKIAQDFDVAILIIAHMNKDSGKNPLHRINGSVDLGAAVRSVLSVEKVPGDPDSQVIFHVKSNLAKNGIPIGYRIQDGVIEWFDGSQYSSEDFFGDERSNREKFSAVEEASEFLNSILRNGPVSYKTILQEATVLEISSAALKRSKKTLGINSTQQWTNGKKGGGDFLWSLPDSVSQPNGLELNHLTDSQDIM
jgi:RecA-family ATPase